ncbi:MAG TPA: FemAB family XrtA/PEP-CTERM system-associated protein [Phycisphaerae bacterium]|nr:FemAB family XrtA/PEP-CTERM system-associated protein [Phycisphaerae bacterium]
MSTAAIDPGSRLREPPVRFPHHPIRVVSFDPSQSDAWRGYVDGHPDGTLFHGLDWKQAVERSFGHRFQGFLAHRNEKMAGVLALYEVRSLFAGRILVSVPYATYGGILGDDESTCGALFQAATDLCRRRGARSIELRSSREMIDSLPVSHSHATFVRELPARKNDVDAILPRKARAAARRAGEKHDLVCEFDNAAMPTMWDLYSRSMRRLASPNYPRKFFDELAAALPDRHIVQIVRCHGRAVAGLLSFLHRDRMMPYFVGLDERADVYGLSHFLYLESMRWAVERGLRVYDFGRSRIDNPGPFEFKRLCGFEPTPLGYQTYVAPGRIAADLSPTSARWSAARRIWKFMPLAMTRPLGGWISKSIPG